MTKDSSSSSSSSTVSTDSSSSVSLSTANPSSGSSANSSPTIDAALTVASSTSATSSITSVDDSVVPSKRGTKRKSGAQQSQISSQSMSSIPSCVIKFMDASALFFSLVPTASPQPQSTTSISTEETISDITLMRSVCQILETYDVNRISITILRQQLHEQFQVNINRRQRRIVKEFTLFCLENKSIYSQSTSIPSPVIKFMDSCSLLSVFVRASSQPRSTAPKTGIASSDITLLSAVCQILEGLDVRITIRVIRQQLHERFQVNITARQRIICKQFSLFWLENHCTHADVVAVAKEHHRKERVQRKESRALIREQRAERRARRTLTPSSQEELRSVSTLSSLLPASPLLPSSLESERSSDPDVSSIPLPKSTPLAQVSNFTSKAKPERRISNTTLLSASRQILKDSDGNHTSTRIVRQELEEKFRVNLPVSQKRMLKQFSRFWHQNSSCGAVPATAEEDLLVERLQRKAFREAVRNQRTNRREKRTLKDVSRRKPANSSH